MGISKEMARVRGWTSYCERRGIDTSVVQPGGRSLLDFLEDIKEEARRVQEKYHPRNYRGKK